MTNELTLKQEQFCQSYIETGNASEAYRRAYDSENMKPETINRNAKALMDDNKIATRVKHLKAQHQKRHNVTVNSLTVELDEAKDLANTTKNPSAAVSAIVAKAKLHGLLIEKRQLETIGRKRTPAQLTDEELEEEIILAREAREARKREEGSEHIH